MLLLGRWPDMLIMCYQVLQYGQSQYLREFGVHVPTPTRLVELDGRIIKAPMLKYNQESRQPNVVCTFRSSQIINDCIYLHKASRKRCMEHVGLFFLQQLAWGHMITWISKGSTGSCPSLQRSRTGCFSYTRVGCASVSNPPNRRLRV